MLISVMLISVLQALHHLKEQQVKADLEYNLTTQIQEYISMELKQ